MLLLLLLVFSLISTGSVNYFLLGLIWIKGSLDADIPSTPPLFVVRLNAIWRCLAASPLDSVPTFNFLTQWGLRCAFVQHSGLQCGLGSWRQLACLKSGAEDRLRLRLLDSLLKFLELLLITGGFKLDRDVHHPLDEAILNIYGLAVFIREDVSV